MLLGNLFYWRNVHVDLWLIQASTANLSGCVDQSSSSVNDVSVVLQTVLSLDTLSLEDLAPHLATISTLVSSNQHIDSSLSETHQVTAHSNSEDSSVTPNEHVVSSHSNSHPAAAPPNHVDSSAVTQKWLFPQQNGHLLIGYCNTRSIVNKISTVFTSIYSANYDSFLITET